jgi:hypothetical protein
MTLMEHTGQAYLCHVSAVMNVWIALTRLRLSAWKTLSSLPREEYRPVAD